jgi:hypothetical protein
MTEIKLVSFRTAKGPRAGVVVGEQLYEAAALTAKPEYGSVLGILRDWRAASGLLKRKASNPGRAPFRPCGRCSWRAPRVDPRDRT